MKENCPIWNTNQSNILSHAKKKKSWIATKIMHISGKKKVNERKDKEIIKGSEIIMVAHTETW